MPIPGTSQRIINIRNDKKNIMYMYIIKNIRKIIIKVIKIELKNIKLKIKKK